MESTTATEDSLDPLPTMTESQRLRHVHLVRQSRLRKKSQRTYLKQMNAFLEHELKQCLFMHHVLYDTLSDSNSIWDIQYKKLVDSIYEIRRLRKEQYTLKTKLLMAEAIQERLELLLDDFKVSELIQPIDFKPSTPFQVQELMMELKTQALSFFQHVQSPYLEQTHGWTQNITVDRSVQFHFTKRITTMSTTDLVEATWKMIWDEASQRRVYSNVQRLDILQKISEDTLLLRRDLQASESSPIFRTIYLLSRVRLENGYVICYRSYNPMHHLEEDRDQPVHWMDVLYWLMVVDPPMDHGVRPIGCDVRFGGNILHAPSPQQAAHWKSGITIALLRWESNVIAPLFTLR